MGSRRVTHLTLSLTVQALTGEGKDYMFFQGLLYKRLIKKRIPLYNWTVVTIVLGRIFYVTHPINNTMSLILEHKNH